MKSWLKSRPYSYEWVSGVSNEDGALCTSSTGGETPEECTLLNHCSSLIPESKPWLSHIQKIYLSNVQKPASFSFLRRDEEGSNSSFRNNSIILNALKLERLKQNKSTLGLLNSCLPPDGADNNVSQQLIPFVHWAGPKKTLIGQQSLWGSFWSEV